MKTTPFFFSGFLLGALVCCAVGSPEPVQPLFGTNLSPLTFSGVLLDKQLRLVIQAASQRDGQSGFNPRSVRLSLDLPRTEPLAATGELPIRTDVNVLPNIPLEERVNRSTESAERVNVEAMRDYRERWKKFLDEFSSRPVPILYPSTVQRTLENTK